MEASAKKLFERYERFFNTSLKGDMNMGEIESLYASDFIAASPAGVMTGKNDDHLKEVMTKAYERYRAIGTKEIRIRDIRMVPIDAHHCIAHVSWTASFARKGQSNVAIDFDVHYFVQKLDGEPKVFGWVSGDEQALLKENGIT
ncbi:nuclear transport factor 2 family protein [Agrobacterium sp. NPDC090283]|uniref:nuclear transport factor 2 family protein n=1 Tax=Agrobacterium sp. NPDC090283 TaxID=3363920 RepID=UPI00383B605D